MGMALRPPLRFLDFSSRDPGDLKGADDTSDSTNDAGASNGGGSGGGGETSNTLGLTGVVSARKAYW